MVKANETNIDILSATANMYYDLLESQGVNLQMIETPEGENKNMLDNKDQNLLPNNNEETDQ